MGAKVIFGREGFSIKRTAGLVLAATIAFSGILGAVGSTAVYAEGSDKAATVYTVEKGDSLERIAKKFGLTVDELAASNNLKKNAFIHTGQKLNINKPAENTATGNIADRGTDPKATPAPADTKNGTISINMADMDIRDILSTIALSMDVDIIYLGDPVKLSFKVDNVTATKALELLVQSMSTSNGTMGYLRDGDIIIVGSQTRLQKDFFNKMVLTRFRVNYITPAVLSAQLDKLGIPVQKITLDKSSKYIWAQGLPQSLTKVSEVIATLDRAENFDADTSKLVASFSLTPYNLDYIAADKLQDLVSQLSLKVKTITIDTNPKVLWASGTAQDLKDLDTLISKVDIPESAGEIFDMEACNLTFLTYGKLMPIIAQLELPAQIIKYGPNQKTLWLKGTAKDLTDLKDLISKIDVKDNSEEYQFFTFTLKNISPADAVTRFEFLDINDVKAISLNYPKLSHDMLLRCPKDMKSTVVEVLLSIDVAGKKIKAPVDSATGGNGAYGLTTRRALLNKLLGIPLENMVVSENISKTAEPYYVLWAEDTPDNIKLIRSMVEQIDSPQ